MTPIRIHLPLEAAVGLYFGLAQTLMKYPPHAELGSTDVA